MTEDAMAMNGWRPCGEQREVELVHAEWFPADVQPPPQSAADVERSKYKAAWCDAMKIELDGHKTIGTYETATPSLGRNL